MAGRALAFRRWSSAVLLAAGLALSASGAVAAAGSSSQALRQAASDWTPPQRAPNAQPWPDRAGYVPGFERLHEDGWSELRIDNLARDGAVYVKIVAVDQRPTYVVRHVYIPARASFTVQRLRPGKYDVRYLDLQTGACARSDPVTVAEDAADASYSVLHVTLYKTRGSGRLRLYALGASDFLRIR
jgi:hypothetical protein